MQIARRILMYIVCLINIRVNSGEVVKMSKKRWWGLKLNGELIMMLDSQVPLTVEDFEHHDVPIPDGKMKVIELNVSQKAKTKNLPKIGALISKWEKQVNDILDELKKVREGKIVFSISNKEAHEQAIRTLLQCIRDVRKMQKGEL